MWDYFDVLLKYFINKLQEMMENEQLIGEGTFGRVYKVKDSSDKVWAVKHMKFKVEDEGLPASALRQITILKNLKSHPNIIELKKTDFFKKDGKPQIRVYFNFCEKDLKQFIREEPNEIPLQSSKRIIQQILCGTAYMHRKGVLHRDLKPQNILLDQNKKVQIADFGLARIMLPTQKNLTRQIQTLFYRAPEVMLGQTCYDQSVDIWGVGCIFAELFLKRPLFLGEGTEIQQIFKVFEIMGTPVLQEWPEFKDLQQSSPRFPKWKKQDLRGIIKNIPQQALDLLEKMLTYDPKRRISAQNALKHPYFKIN